MSVDKLDDAQKQAAGRFIRPESDKEQRLLDVPVAVSVVSGSDLERADLRSLQDVTARLPNVRIKRLW